MLAAARERGIPLVMLNTKGIRLAPGTSIGTREAIALVDLARRAIAQGALGHAIVAARA